MDQQLQKRMDSIVEDEVQRGFRLKSLPPELVRELEEVHAADRSVRVFSRVRLTKLTPRRRRLINEAVLRRYHTDLKNKDILSNEQIRQLNIERGEWSADQEKRLQQLQEETTSAMRELYLDGFDRREEWTQELVDAAEKVRAEIREARMGEGRQPLTDEDKAEAEIRFSRWLDYSPEQQELYNQRYAALQNSDVYSPDRDQTWLLDHAPSVDFVESIQLIEDMRDKLRRYVHLLTQRRELMELQVRESKMFAESVEQRRDTAEEMARMYYTVEVVNDQDIGEGPIGKDFDQCWDLPDSVVQWLLVETYFFLNAIPDEARDFLQQWGFIAAPRLSGSQPPSDASPVEPNVNSDGPPATETLSATSASLTGSSSVISS